MRACVEIATWAMPLIAVVSTVSDAITSSSQRKALVWVIGTGKLKTDGTCWRKLRDKHDETTDKTVRYYLQRRRSEFNLFHCCRLIYIG